MEMIIESFRRKAFWPVRKNRVCVQLSLFFACWMLGSLPALGAINSFNPVHVLQTTSGSELISANTGLDLSGLGNGVRFEFSFGFGTDEEPVSGVFPDSFTISIRGQDALSPVAVFMVRDATSLAIAPSSPGAIPLDPATFSITSVPVPDGIPSSVHQWAYHVIAPVPESLLNQPVNIYFDLFNNGNSLDSVGWASSVVVVPEPGTAMLGLLSLFLGIGYAARQRRGGK